MLGQTRYKKEREIRDKKDIKKLVLYTVLFSLLVIALTLKRCLGPAYKNSVYYPTEKQTGDSSFKWATMVRDYSAHAKFRMSCRHITDDEVQDILNRGNININKSELNEVDCQRKFAIDGYSKDNQHIRVVASPCGNKLTIVTCIDLDKKWPCEWGELNKKTQDEY